MQMPFWNSPQFTQMLTLLIGALIVAIQTWTSKKQNKISNQVKDLHLSVNGRLTELLNETRKASFAAGQKDKTSDTSGTGNS